MPVECSIWNTDAAEIDVGRFDGVGFDSQRTGGRYRISGSAAAVLQTYSSQDRLKLTTWLVDQRRFGELVPEISTQTIKQVSNRPLLSLEERRNRLLFFLLSECPLINQYIDWRALITSARARTMDQLQAWTESAEQKEVSTLIRYAREDGLIESGERLQLTFKGRIHVRDLLGKSGMGEQAFVAMWFDPTMENAFTDGIFPAIQDAGFRPFRIDRKEHSNKIDDEIVAEIRRSRFLVADFTCGFATADSSQIAVARGGVYYEAGFAMGFGMHVIWSCRQDMIDHVHFDTRQYNHIVWNDPAELRTKLRNRIGAVIGDGPLNPNDES